jgi:hypothetical protein
MGDRPRVSVVMPVHDGGAYLAGIDPDDIAFPECLARQVDFPDRHPEVAAVGGGCVRIDRPGARL